MLVAGAALAAPATVAAAPRTVTFDYTGGVQTWTVPPGVTQATFDAYGAQGGRGPFSTGIGLGGHATASFAVSSGTVYQLRVGGRGGDVNTGNRTNGGTPGGFNGGGEGGDGFLPGTGGGGASDVRTGAFGLAERLIVAGGGGGGTWGFTFGGAGGGMMGGNGRGSGTPTNVGPGGGLGGTQIAGGAAGPGDGQGGGPGVNGTQGAGGEGGVHGDGGGGGGGGGGYYGGGGGGAYFGGGGGGGGGSGFGPPGVVFQSGVRAGNGLVTVTYDNKAPVASGHDYTTPEDTSLSVAAPGVLAGDTDAEGDPLSAVLASGPAHGTVSLNANGSFTYTPAADYNGPDSFSYRANDGAVDSNAATISISVSPVNDAPTCAARAATTDEDQAVDVSPSCTDVDGTPLNYAIVGVPAHGTASVVFGRLRYTPAADYNGPDSFTYRASDGSLNSSPATVSITVDAVNDAPVCFDRVATTDEDTAVDVAPSCADVEGSALTYAIAGAPVHGTANVVGGQLRYTPAADYNGSDSFSYTANDGSLDSAVATVAVTVNAVDDPPACSDRVATTDEDSAVTVPPSCADPEGVPTTYAIAAAPTHGTANVVNGQLRYTPGADYNGQDAFTYTADDGALISAPATVTVTVTAVNDAPVCTDVSASTPAGAAIDITASCSDIDSAALTYAIVGGPAHGTAEVVAGRLRYTPAAGYSGPDAFSYQASDGGLSSAPAAVAIVVSAPLPGSPPAVLHAQVTSRSVFTRAGGLARCRADNGVLSGCTVRMTQGRRVIALGSATGTGTLTVELALTKQGRRLLAQRLGGVNTVVRATATSNRGSLSARARTRAMLSVERFVTPPGSWQPNEAKMSDRGRRFVRALRGKLIAVSSVRCAGHAARVGAESTGAARISLERAAVMCAALKRLGVNGRAQIVGRGASRPIATNNTESGRAKNRRVEVTITHRRQRL
jgi:VCBS repeat-containing protein